LGGDLHYHQQLTAPAPEVVLDLKAYREHLIADLAVWERRYTRLDVDPAVALVGQDLRPLPDSRLALSEAFNRHRRLIILGGAGSGKTTSLRYLMISALRGTANEGTENFLPVSIELGRFRAETNAPLDNLLILIGEALFRGGACTEPPSLPGLRKLLGEHRWLFLLDGLNEAKADLRTSALSAIEDLTKIVPDHRIVLSSRPHGFFPPEGWPVVILRELDEAQVFEFVARYGEEGASVSLPRSLLEGNNPLLRLPLFLDLVIRMSRSGHPDFTSRMRSRSGLVAQYAESLLQRDLEKRNRPPAELLSLDLLYGALERLACEFQSVGQVLPLADAERALEANSRLGADEARKILSDLCERGLLATDGQTLRFWHQTLQEYFYAGSIVRRWRGARKQIGRMPRSLRKLVAKTDEEEALNFLVAHLRRPEEVETALRQTLRVNPALAISWADDLSLEGRATSATQQFPARVRRFALAARRYTRAGDRYWETLIVLGVLVPFLVLIALGFLVQHIEAPLRFSLGLSKGEIQTILRLCSFTGILFALVPFLDALVRCPSPQKLEKVFGAIPEICDPFLHQELSAVAREVSTSFLARADLRALALSVSEMESVNGRELVRRLQTSNAPFMTARLIGYMDSPVAVPLLRELLQLNNFLSRAALEALALRAARLRDERQAVTKIFWETWRNNHLDWRIRFAARRFLSRAGETPDGRWRLVGYFLGTSLRDLLLGVAWVAVKFEILGVASNLKMPTLVLSLYFAFLLAEAAFVGWDAHKIGARKLWGFHGHSNGLPRDFSFNCIWFSGGFIPYYLLNRRRIKRDSAPVDWDELLRRAEKTQCLGSDLKGVRLETSALSFIER